MKANVSNHSSLYVDRPLSGKVARRGCASTLRLLSAGEADTADFTMRVFLALCLLASLALGGLRMNAGDHEVHGVDGQVAPTWTKVLPKAPSLTTVQFGPSIR